MLLQNTSGLRFQLTAGIRPQSASSSSFNTTTMVDLGGEKKGEKPATKARNSIRGDFRTTDSTILSHLSQLVADHLSSIQKGASG
ncbi:hypothetical protein AGIG_G21409 [Arapaima gigas]